MSNIIHKNIAVSYRLYTIEDGKEHFTEEAPETQPLQFMSGFGVTLPDFEKEIEPLNTGDEFDFILDEEQAYGSYDPTHVIDVDRSIFTINNHFDHEHIYEGAVVPLQNADGNRFLGKVLEVGSDKVKMDLNHPLAGCKLNFRGKVIESRVATDEEVQAFIERMNSHECGCGCGDCDGGCDGHHGEDGCGHHHGDGGHCGKHEHGGCCGHH